jgi:hypothetical protein
MSQEVTPHKPAIDWLMVVAIAAIAISLNVAFHEGVHALTCVAVGGQLQAYSALYASCDSQTVFQEKMIAGSAPIYNLLAGLLLWTILRNSRKKSSETQLFLWLFMLINWFYGAGYLMFSGIANIGDWAVVIDGWEPSWLWRVLIVIIGALFFFVFIRVGLQELGKMIGEGQIRRVSKLFILSYITSFVVILLAGFFCPYGLLSLPVTAGVFAVLVALSPFLGMTWWFETKIYEYLSKEPLEIHRRWQWIAAAVVVVFAYVFILGRTLYF